VTPDTGPGHWPPRPPNFILDGPSDSDSDSDSTPMPITHEQAQKIVQRLARGRSIEGLADVLAPVPIRERPAPPPVPGQRDWSAEALAERVAFLEERGHRLDHVAGRAAPPDPASFRGSIENQVGMASIPLGVIGPLRVNGLHASGDFYVPLATSEGALVASYDRGARVLTEAGGVSALVTTEHVQRAPAFVFDTMASAALFATWVVGEFERLQEVAASRTRHGRLLDISVHLQGNQVYLILDYYTGDAAGQNMVTLCTQAVCEDVVERSPSAPRSWYVESNMSGDKKATALSFARTRGRNVTAEALLPRELVTKALRTTPERMTEYWRVSFIGGVQTGSIGVSGHASNGLAALFLACGQDVACVSEASVGVTRLELTDDGDLYAMVNLPNLIVGTVGGGTRLPTASECLALMGCDGPDTAPRFAEICAGVILGGELSIVAALCAGDFARAHAVYGRPS
jgi:hydroxymethylglutaryl-CoA reductase (NADPH)